MTTEKLRDCPFCGSRNVGKHLGVGLMWTVGCDDCGSRTKECTYSIDAVTSWNRRAGDPAEESAMDDMSMPMPCEDTPF